MNNTTAIIFAVSAAVILITLFVIFSRMSENYALGKIDFMMNNFGKSNKIKFLTEPYMEVENFEKTGKFYKYDMYFEQDVENVIDTELEVVPVFVFLGSGSMCNQYKKIDPYSDDTVSCRFTLITDKPSIVFSKNNPFVGSYSDKTSYVVGNYTVRILSDYKGASLFNWKRHAWVFKVDIIGYEDEFTQTFTFQSKVLGSKTYHIHIPMKHGIVDIDIKEKRTLGIFGRRLDKLEIETSGGLKDPKGPSIPVEIFYFERGCKFLDSLIGLKPKSEQVFNAFQMCTKFGLNYARFRMPINKII